MGDKAGKHSRQTDQATAVQQLLTLHLGLLCISSCYIMLQHVLTLLVPDKCSTTHCPFSQAESRGWLDQTPDSQMQVVSDTDLGIRWATTNTLPSMQLHSMMPDWDAATHDGMHIVQVKLTQT